MESGPAMQHLIELINRIPDAELQAEILEALDNLGA